MGGQSVDAIHGFHRHVFPILPKFDRAAGGSGWTDLR